MHTPEIEEKFKLHITINDPALPDEWSYSILHPLLPKLASQSFLLYVVTEACNVNFRHRDKHTRHNTLTLLKCSDTQTPIHDFKL